jgi:hypothetical protein
MQSSTKARVDLVTTDNKEYKLRLYSSESTGSVRNKCIYFSWGLMTGGGLNLSAATYLRVCWPVEATLNHRLMLSRSRREALDAYAR